MRDGSAFDHINRAFCDQQGDEAEQAAAAVRIQAAQRGKAERRTLAGTQTAAAGDAEPAL